MSRATYSDDTVSQTRSAGPCPYCGRPTDNAGVCARAGCPSQMSEEDVERVRRVLKACLEWAERGDAGNLLC